MAVTRAKKSSITTSSKRIDANAGNLMYPWWGDWGSWGNASRPFDLLSNSGSGISANGVACIETASGAVQISIYAGGPPVYWSLTSGTSWVVGTPANYSNYPGAFNGAFVAGGNYSGSGSYYSNDLLNGWTSMGAGGAGYSFGYGTGGWIHNNLPLWAIPYTYSGTHYVRWTAGPMGSYGISNGASWTDTSVNTAGGGGYASKIAVIGYPDTGSGSGGFAAYAGYNSTTLSTAAFFMRGVVFSSTGTVVTTTTITPPAITGLMQSFVGIGNTLILSTADNKLYTSTDGGITWVTRTSPFTGSSPLYISAPSAGRVIASTGASTGYTVWYQSSDGATWTAFANNLSAPTNTAANGVGVTENGFVYISSTSGAAARLKSWAG